MDLVCTPQKVIGLMVTAYFVGFTIGGLFYSLPDKYGRRKALVFGMLLSCIAQCIAIYIPTIWARSAAFFLMGLAQIKIGVAYVWLAGCTSSRYKPRAFTIINIFDALPMTIICLYFMFISKDWYPICLFMLVLSFVATGLAFLCPESPRWHLVNGRGDEAIEMFNQIAKINGSEV